MEKKIYDSDLLRQLNEQLITNYYYLGAYSDYNGMDVKNIKNEIIDAIKKSK